MASPIATTPSSETGQVPDEDEEGLPLLYEDDEEGDLGESNPHVDTEEIFRNGVKAHLAGRPEYRVYSNMNLYYSPKYPAAYVSPDTMVVTPWVELPDDLTSYRIDEDGPVPELSTEVLSARSAQQQDLGKKMKVYAMLGVKEYILIDISGRFLPERLLLKRLQTDGTWKDERNADGSVTSQFGFRVTIDTDGRLRILDDATGKGYVRPDEAEERVRAAIEARRKAEEQAQAESEARRKAEEQAQAESEARRKAERQLLAQAAELARLRAIQSDSAKKE